MTHPDDTTGLDEHNAACDAYDERYERAVEHFESELQTDSEEFARDWLFEDEDFMNAFVHPYGIEPDADYVLSLVESLVKYFARTGIDHSPMMKGVFHEYIEHKLAQGWGLDS